jgi:hypothetical protein
MGLAPAHECIATQLALGPRLGAPHLTQPAADVGPNGRVSAVFPPTGRGFRVEQIHRHEMRGGEVVGHLARRDDLGMMEQLGHLPPGPRSLLRMLAWRLSGTSRRAAIDATAVGARAAALMIERLERESADR